MRFWLVVVAGVALSTCSPGEAGSLVKVSITSPSAAVLTNGVVAVTLDVTGTPDKVVLLRDGEEVVTVASPFTSASVDTATWTEAAHQLSARATRGMLVVDSAAVEVTVDRTAPTVTRRWPEDTGAAAWWLEAIGVELSEPVMAAGASPLSAQLDAGTATLSAGQLSTDGRTFTATPTQPLSAVPDRAQLTLAAGAFVDRAGNATAAVTWSVGLSRWAKTNGLVAAGRAGSFARVAVDDKGVAYVAFSESQFQGGNAVAGSDRVVVARIRDARVESLAVPVTFAAVNGAAYPALAIDPTGRAVVAWQDNQSSTPSISAARLEAGAWVALGTTVGAGAFPDLGFDAAGNPVVAFTERGTGARVVRVSKWSGTAWVAAAADLSTTGVGGLADPSGPSLAMEGDVPTLAYVEAVAGVTTVKVSSAMGMTGWSAVGAPLNVRARSAARWPRLALRAGTLFIAWEETDDQNPSVHVAQRAAGGWTRVGRPLDLHLSHAARWPAIAIDSTGAPIVAWAEESDWGRWTLPISRYAAGEWSSLGGEELAGGKPTLMAGSVAVFQNAAVVALHQFETGGFASSQVSLHRYNGVGVPSAFGIAQRPAASTCSLGLDTGTAVTSLAATGCFTLGAMPPRAAADLLPYDLITPLWSDGALKRRWVRLPAGQSLGYHDVGTFDFPNGTMMVKEFSYDVDPADATSRRPVETRFLVKRDDAGWEGYSYQWNTGFTDATLLDDPSTVRVTWAHAGQTDGGGHVQIYPTRDQCRQCHQAAAGDVLGLVAGQLNRSYDYGGAHDNQLRALAHVGAFGGASPDAGRMVSPFDTTETLARRVRGYLQANCAHCHRPGGSRQTRDFRWETPFSDTNICDAGAPFGVEISPGDAGQSLMISKLRGRGPGQKMPPLATDVVDEAAVNVVEEWIDGLTQCQ